jgi:hypothetical protein
MNKQKLLRTTTTGISNLQLNEIGNAYLHKQSKVGIVPIEKSRQGRAIVYDQHIIDRLYIDSHINEQQHNILNKYLSVISRSGCFPSCFPDANKIFTGQYSNSPPKAVVLVKVQKYLRKELGYRNESKLWKIFIENPKILGQKDIKLMVASGDCLMSYWFIGHQSPVSLFQQALSNPI